MSKRCSFATDTRKAANSKFIRQTVLQYFRFLLQSFSKHNSRANNRLNLQRCADPERVACINWFVRSTLEASVLSEQTPASHGKHLSCGQRTVESSH